MEAFEQRFKKGYPDWQPYKNKYDTCRKKYTKIKRLTKNRTGLGFDNMGRINMSDDCVLNCLEFSQTYIFFVIQECPGIRKSVCNEIDNMDLFEAEFGGVVVTGAEGWSAQHGEASFNSRVGFDDDEEADSQPATETQPLETETQRQTQPTVQTHYGSCTAKRKRKEKDMVVEAWIKQTEALEVKNKIEERMLELQEASSVENVLEILYVLPGVIEWSPLYEAIMELFIDSEGNRRAFITMKTDEAKIKFLELRTKINVMID
ncbi:hypothetical protein N665_0016s0051 [Sinapis alba]|nr:hypothetical protein N665_0016s0051 [Sinapis alba]